MKKRMISLVLALVMVLSLIPSITMTASAAAVDDGNGHVADNPAKDYYWVDEVAFKTSGGQWFFTPPDPNHSDVNARWNLSSVESFKMTLYDAKYRKFFNDDFTDEYWIVSPTRNGGMQSNHYNYLVNYTTKEYVNWHGKFPNGGSYIAWANLPAGIYLPVYAFQLVDWEDDGLFYSKLPEPEYMNITLDGEALPYSRTANVPNTVYMYENSSGVTIHAYGDLVYIYDEKPEIHSVSVNGVSVSNGDTVYSNKSGISITTTYDSTLSDAMLEYGCTDIQCYSRWYLNGEKINQAMVNPVNNGDGTASKTYYRSLNNGDVFEIESWLEVTWPDGSRDIVDKHAATVVYEMDAVSVGDVLMADGDYLAVGANATTRTMPNGGYAYYKDGVLTLNYFYTTKLVRYYDRYLEVNLIGENEVGSIADYYYWADSSDDHYTGLEFTGSGDLEIRSWCQPGCEISVNGDVFFNGSGFIFIDADIYCFQYTDNVVINDGYVYCYSAQSGVFGDATNIEVNGGKLEMVDGGGWWQFICDGTVVTAGDVYVSNSARRVQPEECDPWDGKTPLKDYDTVWVVPEGSVDSNKNPFTDVPEGSFYYEPVLWAVENGITTGATATTFNPGGNCLRAHVVTFLHRAAGNPEPTSTKNPFTDVKSTDFYYKPVLWAVEKGITNGTTATTFGSYENCNRAAVVTFLWRAAGSPEPESTNNPFVDVKTTDFFYKPVLWAIEKGITNGVDATHFGPTTACNRAQVVTFLYRAYN